MPQLTVYRHTISASILNLNLAFYTKSPIHQSEKALRVLYVTQSEKEPGL